MLKASCNNYGILKASKTIKNGGVIIFPTDTVYGIGGDPYNNEVVKRIYKIKSRDKNKSFPILIDSKDTAAKIADFDKYSERLAEKFWPGPVTIVLAVTDMKLKKSLNLDKKIALRIPNNNCTLQLLKKCKFLIGTSANISGQESFTDPIQCYQNITDVDLLLDGGILNGKPSTIIEIVNNEIKIHRNGSITKKEIRDIF